MQTDGGALHMPRFSGVPMIRKNLLCVGTMKHILSNTTLLHNRSSPARHATSMLTSKRYLLLYLAVHFRDLNIFCLLLVYICESKHFI